MDLNLLDCFCKFEIYKILLMQYQNVFYNRFMFWKVFNFICLNTCLFICRIGYNYLKEIYVLLMLVIW